MYMQAAAEGNDAGVLNTRVASQSILKTTTPLPRRILQQKESRCLKLRSLPLKEA